MKRAMLCSGLLVLTTLSWAFAGGTGDGERIAATCAGCHGTQGASPGSHIPVIGGQRESYLKQSMQEYRDGARPGGVMANLAKGYSDSQIDECSKIISSWKWKNTPLTRKGKTLPAAVAENCVDCHGKRGEGTDMAPHISGQAPGYLKDALQEYKNGKRKSSDMEIVKKASEAELDALVTYYTALK